MAGGNQKSGKLTRRQLLKRAVGGAVVLTGGYAALAEPRWLETLRITVPIKDLPDAFEGYRIGFMTDFHLGNWIDPAFVNEAGRGLMEEGVDLLLLGGDYMHKTVSATADIAPAFKDLSAPDGVLGVTGNHDHWTDADRVVKTLEGETPVRIIDGEIVTLKRAGSELALVGTKDYWHSSLEEIGEQLDSLPEHAPRLMLQHNPDVAEELIGNRRVDLQLSGHTHGGQVVMPFTPSYIPSSYGWKFARGLVEGKSHRVYVSKGVGGAAFCRARFCARPDVSIITLTVSGPTAEG